MTNRLEQFKKDGYLILDGFNTNRECDDLIKQAAKLVAGFNYDGHPSVFQTDDQTKTSDEYFLNSGGQISFFLIIQSMYIFKHAGIGGNVDVHQDAGFLYTEPQSCVGFWFALEDATKENGCLWAMPGGHRTALRSWFRRKEGGGTEKVTLNNESISIDNMKALEGKKGTCIVLDGLLPHYSLPNTSGKSRQAYSIHSINKNCNYPKEKWLQGKTGEITGI